MILKEIFPDGRVRTRLVFAEVVDAPATAIQGLELRMLEDATEKARRELAATGVSDNDLAALWRW